MKELSNSLNSELIMEEIKRSINTVKRYKQQLRQLLKEIKIYYSYEDFMHCILDNSMFTDCLSRLDATLKFKIGKPIITIASNIDPQVTVSTKLLTENNDIWWNYYLKHKKRSVMYVEDTQSKTHT